MTKTKIPLHQLLSESDLSRDVAWTPTRTVGWGTLRTRVAGLSERLQEESIERWTLVAENSYAFLVGLLATWQAGDIAVLPPNAEPEMVEGIAGETGGIITDQDELTPFGETPVDPLDFEGDPETLSDVDPERVTTEMMTSGSTGERKVVPKTLNNFWHDIKHYDDLWGDIIGDSIVFSSVSHQHIFGLFFKVLWPFLEGRAFYPDAALYPGDLANLLDQVTEAYLVSSPAPLERLVRSGELGSARGTVTAVFSGGGVIDPEVAERVNDELGFYPFSVFGSTEAGGIAWRQRDPNLEHPDWNTFPETEIKINETEELFVRSKTVSDNLEEWYPTGDLAEEHEKGHFVLKGRADRVIKITEKRVSLPQIEAKLLESDYVDEAVTTVLDEEDARKKELGAAIELSDAGIEFLEGNAREDLRKTLRDDLRGYVDDVAIPRDWIFEEKLPRDHMSKISQDTVKELFD